MANTVYLYNFQDNVNTWSVPIRYSFFKEFYPHGTIFANEISICQNNTIEFSVFDTTIDTDSVYWDFGDGSDIILAEISDIIIYQYNAVGEYEVTCTFKHIESGKSTDETITVFVHTVYENLPIKEVEICADKLPYVFGNQEIYESGYYEEIFQSTNGCDSLVMLNFKINELSYRKDVVTACDSYTWIDGITYTESNNSAEFVLTNVAGCDSIVTLDLTINKSPHIEVVVDRNILTVAESDAIYQWKYCDDRTIALENAQEQTFVATANGQYVVEVSKNGCVATSECYEVVTVGISHNLLNNITVYPNPNDGKFVVDLGKMYDEIFYEITDMHGAVVYKNHAKATRQLYIDMQVTQGVYVLLLYVDTNKNTIKIIVK
ncbi:MAG: PKD domain-containing protein [Bacteroidales bacterium]|nr:PKD domain-containing protein [Bacteroidales bacterium]